jgi:hypothetical protein
MIIRINEIFPNWMTTGIFSKLSNYDVPWKNTVESKTLDIAYHGGYSGNKIISPLLENMLTDGSLSDDSANMIAMSIVAICGTNWSKLWDTLNFEYNPIENYSMTETETATGESTNKGTATATSTGNNATYGFNSTDAVNADKSDGTNTETTENAVANLNNRELTRSGNIGVTTSQQMIQSERDLWNWYFYDIVFKDVDNMLTLSIY